jgi:small GTP-binding protein
MRNNNITQDTSCIKVVLVGESNTGKTSIINRFCSDIFNEETHVTVGCSCLSRTIEVAPYQKVKLKIWDTAGQETYRSINKIFYKEAKIVIFVYDITNIKSFKEIGSYWLHEVKNTVDEDTGK